MIDLAWLVDDDNIYTYITTKQMQQVSFCNRLEVFHTGQQALDKLQLQRDTPEALPNLIMLDLNMPGVDGWQFLDVFSTMQFSKPIRIYIVSSSIDPSDHERIQQYRFVSGFFVKPLKRETLKQMMNELSENA